MKNNMYVYYINVINYWNKGRVKIFFYFYVISVIGNIKVVVVVEVFIILLKCIGDDVERVGSYKRFFVLCFV